MDPVPVPARLLPITRRIPAGRAVVDRQTIHIHDLAAGGNRVPGISGFPTGYWHSHLTRDSIAAGEYSHRCALEIRRTEVRPFHREANRTSQNLRRPGRDRHRERAVVQGTRGAQRGIARGAGASDGNGRGARHHQPLAHGRAAGPRRHRRERRPGLWDR